MAAAPQIHEPDVIVEFRRLMTDYKTTWELALKEFRDKGEVTGETKTRLVKIDSDVADAIVKVNAMETRVAAAEADVKTLKERGSRPPVQIGGSPDPAPTIGQQITEHESFKGLAGVQRPHAAMTLKGRILRPYEQRVINPFIGEATSGYILVPRRIGTFTQPTVPLIMRDLLDVIPLTSGNAIEYVQETWTLNADYQVAEGDKKAQSDVTYTDKTESVKTIAHYVKISRQMLADVPFIRASIDTRLVYGIALKEDKELLYGTGAAGHLRGIMPQATAYAAPAGITITNVIDQMYAAMLQLMAAGYPPTAIVLNPLAFGQMALARNAMGLYVLGGPPATEPNPRLWGLPVAMTMNMIATDFLVGSFPGNAALFDRETPTVDIAFENEDDFVRNLVCIRAEERVALAVYVPQAFIKGTLFVPTP